MEQLGADMEKAAASPGVSGAEEDDHDDDQTLTGEDVTRYRAVTARANYMAADRPACLYAVK